jgi:hypothetical protein
MVRTARAILRIGNEGMFCWVLEQNRPAQNFYRALGGTCVERAQVFAPGGQPDRLAGSPKRFRYVWPSPTVLLDHAAELTAARVDG